ncbi:hypothetical protein NPIL_254631 [Nephila pilipes]|uniref:Uncharacterized protein n=1 Tax=Nephila pilipes TaxID=299642 RepID=A0A8X6MHH0_NEPPI|nr:hypothetical protein NPIL_254631 [Nephila pilipes]
MIEKLASEREQRKKREQKRKNQTRERTTQATPSSQSESSHPHLPAPTSPGIGSLLVPTVVDHNQPENSLKTKRSFQNASPPLTTMEEASFATPETPQVVSIPTIQNIVTNITSSDQCLHADAKLSEYINNIPLIAFQSQEAKNAYATDLYTIQEEVRTKFNSLKKEELRVENEKYLNLVNSWGLPDASKPQSFQLQSRRKNSTPVKKIANKKQKTADPTETECSNKFSTLAIEELPESIEIDEDEDVTPPPMPKKTYAPPITIDNIKNSAELLKKLQYLTGIKLTAKLIGHQHTPVCALCQGPHTANHLLCPMNPLNRPKKEDKKSSANEQRLKLKNILKEKREIRASRPAFHTALISYAEATKNSPAPTSQDSSPTTSTSQASTSNITDIFQQLKDPECLEMFTILKKYIIISKSGKSVSERFTEIAALLQINV